MAGLSAEGNFRIILIPARGRKLKSTPATRTPARGLYSSPRGDGNEFICAVAAGLGMIILIPARGRKRPTPSTGVFKYGLYSSPRGDGNKRCYHQPSGFYRLYSSPRGDGNDRARAIHYMRNTRLYSSPRGDGNDSRESV